MCAIFRQPFNPNKLLAIDGAFFGGKGGLFQRPVTSSILTFDLRLVGRAAPTTSDFRLPNERLSTFERARICIKESKFTTISLAHPEACLKFSRFLKKIPYHKKSDETPYSEALVRSVLSSYRDRCSTQGKR